MDARALQAYREKRDFDKTREPRGTKARAAAGHSYVVQKHAARQLHYDFRLELDGVLKSWAVTRGPSLVPADKRLAVEVEDHPIEYGSFEGTIPKGQYGGGSVIVWDRGTWAPEGDARKGLAKGHLDFRLDGEKLRGRWHLVRMARQHGKKRTNWLLIKAKDEDARAQGEPDILVEEPQSVASGREVEQIGEADDVWDSSEGRMARGTATKAASNKAKPKRASKPESAPRSATPVKARSRSVAVTLTHPDRVYWPDAGLTKQGLADYYADVWKWMAPHVIARPLALLRCPDGIAKQCFFQKQPWKGLHQSIAVLSNPGAGGDKFLAVENLDGVVALVQAGVLEIHPWGSTVGDLGHPDRLIFDLDPGPHVGWAALVDAAVEVRERLGRDGLESFVKTSGGKGLHVVAPLRPEADWDAAKSYARGIAEAMAKDDPQRYTAAVSKAARARKILVDYLRNARGATAVVPYGTRARAGAPVSAPLAWEELGPKLQGDSFNVGNMRERISRLRADPWASFFEVAQSLPAGPAARKTKRKTK
jgi:bifunctional non-homologous end joining protein LigD